MRELLETLQREGLDTVAASVNNVPRDFQFPTADNIIKACHRYTPLGQDLFFISDNTRSDDARRRKHSNSADQF